MLPAQDDGTDAAALLARIMSPPFFPIPPSALRGRWRIRTTWMRPGSSG